MNPKEYAKFLKTLPPETAEAVKACMRAGMDATAYHDWAQRNDRSDDSNYEEFSKLSEAGDTRPIARINKPTKLEPIFGDSEAGDK